MPLTFELCARRAPSASAFTCVTRNARPAPTPTRGSSPCASVARPPSIPDSMVTRPSPSGRRKRPADAHQSRNAPSTRCAARSPRTPAPLARAPAQPARDAAAAEIERAFEGEAFAVGRIDRARHRDGCGSASRRRPARGCRNSSRIPTASRDSGSARVPTRRRRTRPASWLNDSSNPPRTPMAPLDSANRVSSRAAFILRPFGLREPPRIDRGRARIRAMRRVVLANGGVLETHRMAAARAQAIAGRGTAHTQRTQLHRCLPEKRPALP